MRSKRILTTTPGDPLVGESSFLRECLAQRDAVNRHRSRLAKGSDRDICFDEALVDWMLRKRGRWIARRRAGRG